MNQIKALYKYLISYFKNDWKFKDYPLKTWNNQNAEIDELKFGASFTNWTMFVAHGNRKEVAIDNLKIQFKDYKAKNDVLPRPGKKVPIQYAESTEIEKYEDIAIDFFDEIIEMDYFSCFISDHSSLHEFDIDTLEAVEKIKSKYHIELDEDLILVDIFKQIKFASA
ncbi:hypothetical protein [Flavobacterium sp. 5]|uniref:hypothetical protein n=1 Tax=Flavobacterium sp. 5 TaxID=2035199 RepID=UPI000C2C65A9|nr:hypothetical protein [Flavobacterium sp. 5]PKB15266.1 hypothetical protein CLU82_0330 [Flavobacterium sp. 5]